MDSRLNELLVTGCCRVEPLTALQITETNEWLLSRPVYANAHVPQTARNRGEEPVSRSQASWFECVCVHTDDAILAPHLLEKALSLIDLAAAYVKRDPPVTYSANAFWTRPGKAAPRGDIQEFHCDVDDKSFLAMFVYLTDVLRDEDGPHDLTGPLGDVSTIRGPAGTVFLADTSRPHRGRKPQAAERGIAWVRWGVSDRPAANEWDHIEPIVASRLGARYPSDPRLRESIRLLAA